MMYNLYINIWWCFSCRTWYNKSHLICIIQVVYWLIFPKLLREEKMEDVMTIAQLIFLFQFFPKLYHCFYLMRGVRKVTGYLFGTVWWGFILNLIAYFLASHVRIHLIHNTHTHTNIYIHTQTYTHIYIIS